ncbi:hypothetical protein SmJEL517_g05976 [Synchytrium microbalum]|uniref:TauD/TfdA-like domain-containing protein n=1 Tax=Synchytrium microbalum TaxID=1806994 RepID=A0A507BXL5_9FUNG|nr:uncharacterized protein SmJEL517_g05976 [Synchytrium microbalum]TPX30466.1 hypothetical protein SmJEL517_g05976 [Synchytrium microbalum]
MTIVSTTTDRVSLPSARKTVAQTGPKSQGINYTPARGLRVQPKKYSGSLDQFESFQPTPNIGLEFKDLQLANLSDRQIEDLSILVSQYGVVFLRAQSITAEQQLEFGRKIASPKGTLHVHPLTFKTTGSALDEISVISNELPSKEYSDDAPAADGWHADITFEKTPSNYAALQINDGPETGGDTLFSSGYAAYDRLSAPLKKFLEGLTAIHNADFFNNIAGERGSEIRTDRGADNTGLNLTAVHPVIRTNPVTGWKSIFVNKVFTKKIVELRKDESDAVLAYLHNHIAGGHDFNVRFKWGPGDIAIWDNRSVFHTATKDFDPSILRRGNRVVPLGEKPYFDPASSSRTESIRVSKL